MGKLLLLFLICLYISTNAFCQKAVNHKFYITNYGSGLCNASIILFNDGTYRHESGCESSSYISYGKWTVKNDTVNFKPLNNRTFKVIDSIIAMQTPKDSISVTILDKNGINITNKISIGLHVPGIGIYLFEPDKTDTKKVVYKRSTGKIYLWTLSRIFQQDFEIPTDTANNFIIKLNFSTEWIYNSNSV